MVSVFTIDLVGSTSIAKACWIALISFSFMDSGLFPCFLTVYCSSKPYCLSGVDQDSVVFMCSDLILSEQNCSGMLLHLNLMLHINGYFNRVWWIFLFVIVD